MLSMLIEIFGGDAIAGRRRFAGERDIALEHLIGVAADLDARTVAVEGLHPVRHARSVGVVAAAPASAATIVAAAMTLVLAGSHDTFEIAV